MQVEITQPIPLLDGAGNLTQAGYAKRLLPVYDRKKVRGGLTRLKEWDYYYVGNSRYGVALTVADNSYMGLDSISFLSFEDRPTVFKISSTPSPGAARGCPPRRRRESPPAPAGTTPCCSRRRRANAGSPPTWTASGGRSPSTCSSPSPGSRRSPW